MKKAWKHVIALVVIVMISVVADVLIFNRSALTDGYENVVYNADNMMVETIDSLAQLSAEEQHALQVELENQRLVAEYNGEEFILSIDESLVERDGLSYQKVKETHIQMKLGAVYYINKLKLSLPVEESAGYTVSLYENDTLYNNIY